MNDFGNGILVAVGIGLLIFVHELGHYLAARWIKARVEVFSLGFGPRLIGFRRGPTDYRLSLIPIGGYVAVAGQDPGDQGHRPGEGLHEKTPGQRALFFMGGVVMNLLFALIAFPIAFGSGVSFSAPEIGRVEAGGAAWEARLQPGDRILAIDGKEVYSFDNLQVEVALAGGRSVSLQIERAGERRTIEVAPQFQADAGFYAIGIEPALTDQAPTLIVANDGAAAAAGLRSEDELLAIDGQSLVGNAALAVAPATGMQPQELTVRRQGVETKAAVTPRAAATPAPPQIGVRPLACRVGAVRAGNAAVAALGLRHGDRVLAVDGATFRGPDLASAGAGGPELTLVVQRGDARVQLRAPCSEADRRQLDEHIALTPDLQTALVVPVPGTAAEAAGLTAGDRVVRIDDAVIDDWSALRRAVLAVGEHGLRIGVLRPGAGPDAAPQAIELLVQPRVPEVPDYGYSWQIQQKRSVVRATGFADALRRGTISALDLIKQLYVTMKRLFTGDVAARNLGGIIQISRASYQNTQWGLPRFLYFLALLSINLAFINVLPIPVLDGGHLLFVLIERIKGSPVSTRVLNYSQLFGLVLVLALVLFVTYNDILRLL